MDFLPLNGALTQDLVGSLQLPILVFQRPQPVTLGTGETGAFALVNLCASHPFTQRVRRTANLIGDGS